MSEGHSCNLFVRSSRCAGSRLHGFPIVVFFMDKQQHNVPRVEQSAQSLRAHVPVAPYSLSEAHDTRRFLLRWPGESDSHACIEVTMCSTSSSSASPPLEIASSRPSPAALLPAARGPPACNV